MRLLLWCDEPNLNSNSQIEGIRCVQGWAAPRSEVSKIDIFVDEMHAGSAFYGFVRPDVIRSHPKLGGDHRIGFAFRLNTTKLSTGVHVLRIVATGRNGATVSVEGNVQVTSVRGQGGARMDGQAPPAGAYGSRRELTRSFISSVGQPVEASVMIFTRNQAEMVDRSLSIISRQKTSFGFEVIGVDTESTDGTRQVFKRYGARLVSVRPDEFHHVRTRLRSLSEASGKFVVFLVGDAIPVDEYWLEGLMRPLIEDPLVAAAYSRQLPAGDCVPWEARDICLGCSVVREVKRVDWSQPAEVENYHKHQWKFISFSDVSACYRRALLESLPILDALPEVEDQYWCKCLLELGYRVVLEPTSLVIHSHNHSLRQLYRRQIRFGRCFATFMDTRPEPLHKVLFRAMEDAAADLFFIAGSKTSWLRKCKWVFRSTGDAFLPSAMAFAKDFVWGASRPEGKAGAT